MKNDNSRVIWVFVIGFLLLIGVTGGAVVYSVRQTLQQAENAVQPVSDLTSNVATQVARALNPTPTIVPDPITIIHQVRNLSRLETIQYSVEKIITAETRQGPFGFLFGDRLILVAHGEVIAGVDLAKLGPDDLQIEGGALYVRLPESEIFIASLDNEKSYIYDRDRGALTRGDINLETDARRAAEAEIEKAALEDGILDQAQQNAENFLYQFFRRLGYPEVIFGSP